MTPAGWGRMACAGARVEFERNQANLVVSPFFFIPPLPGQTLNLSFFQGCHSFPRASLGPRRTVVPTISYPAAETKRILGTCKAHGTTLSHTVFALCNLSYSCSVPAGTGPGERDERLPLMLYLAMNVQPFLKMSEGTGTRSPSVTTSAFHTSSPPAKNLCLMSNFFVNCPASSSRASSPKRASPPRRSGTAPSRRGSKLLRWSKAAGWLRGPS